MPNWNKETYCFIYVDNINAIVTNNTFIYDATSYLPDNKNVKWDIKSSFYKTKNIKQNKFVLINNKSKMMNEKENCFLINTDNPLFYNQNLMSGFKEFKINANW